MDVDINVQMPFLWGNQRFERSKWGALTYLVGPNGTGKTRFAEALRDQLRAKGYRVRYLSAERMVSLPHFRGHLMIGNVDSKRRCLYAGETVGTAVQG